MARRRSDRPVEPEPVVDRARRTSYQFDYTEEYRRDERALDPEMRRRITTFLQARFRRAWRDGTTPTDLNNLWDFKLLEGKDARRLQVFQLRPNNKYRVALIDVPVLSPPYVFFVGVFLKGKNVPDIARATAAAARKREAVASLLRGSLGALEEKR